MAEETILLTQEELEQRCREWQKVMSLQDWTVHIEIVRYLGEVTSGNCSYHTNKKQAVIKLVEPEGYPADHFTPQDMELDLVHELAHLYFAPLKTAPDSPEEVAEEQAVHHLSTALVALKRQAEKGAEVQ